MYADMHVHSCFSDGTMTPADLVAAARESRVSLLCVADHDLLEGSLAAGPLCERAGIAHILAVEIDTLEGGVNHHLLAYGFAEGDMSFRAYLAHTRFLLEEMGVKLVEAMRADYAGLSLPDFFDFSYEPCLGGWKALHYLLAKGVTSSLKEGVAAYRRYGVAHGAGGFSTLAAAALRVRRAGGAAVLAHPGETMDTTDLAAFTAQLRRFCDLGLSGVECHYPTHSAEVTAACLAVCRERGLLVTAGSDCHGGFGKTRVGAMRVPVSALALDGLWPPR